MEPGLGKKRMLGLVNNIARAGDNRLVNEADRTGNIGILKSMVRPNGVIKFKRGRYK